MRQLHACMTHAPHNIHTRTCCVNNASENTQSIVCGHISVVLILVYANKTCILRKIRAYLKDNAEGRILQAALEHVAVHIGWVLCAKIGVLIDDHTTICDLVFIRLFLRMLLNNIVRIDSCIVR